MATMSYEDWLRSQGYSYNPSSFGINAGRGLIYSGWTNPAGGQVAMREGEQVGAQYGLPSQYQTYMTQAENPRVSYSGQAFSPILPDSTGWLPVSIQGGGGIQYGTGDEGGEWLRYHAPNGLMPFLGYENNSLGYRTGGDDNDGPSWVPLLDASGNPITRESLGLDKTYGYDSYENAKNTFSSGYVPWNIDNVSEGLSNRQPFNLNALWGGTQYAQGRVTDWSHLDPTQYQANVIAANTRNELWNEYDKLVAQGTPPAKNPDEVALDFYVKNVGPSGNQFGYGPGANTAMITEAIKHQFLNSPDVVQATGTTYQTPQEKLAMIDEFGAAHQSGVPTWQVFEQQQYGGRDWLGSLIPMIIGGMALGPLAGAFGGGLAGNALAGALIGGTTSEISGGDFLKGALTGGFGAGLTSGLGGFSSDISSALNVDPAIADAIARAASSAVRVGVSGGDIEQAIIGSLINSGVGGAVSGGLSESGLSPDLVKTISGIASPAISTALQGGDYESALTNSLLKSGFSLLKDGSWGVNPQSTSGGDAEAQEGGFYGEPVEDSYDPIPLGYKTREDVAADNPDLYQDGVIPESGMMTIFNPDGTVEYVPQTPVDTYSPSGGISSGTSGGTAGTTGGTSGGTAGAAGGTSGGVNYGALGQKIQNIWNVQEPNYPSPVKPFLSPSFIGGGKYDAPQVPEYSQIIGQLANVLGKRGYKVGGSVHIPGPEGKLYEKHDVRGFAVGGPGTGQSDDIPTMLSDGEYVIDADTVAALGDGSSKAGAEILDKFRQEIRSHKRSAPTDRIPPKAKNPLAYLKAAQKAKG